jgi:hypothetical protein
MLQQCLQRFSLLFSENQSNNRSNRTDKVQLARNEPQLRTENFPCVRRDDRSAVVTSHTHTFVRLGIDRFVQVRTVASLLLIEKKVFCLDNL